MHHTTRKVASAGAVRDDGPWEGATLIRNLIPRTRNTLCFHEQEAIARETLLCWWIWRHSAARAPN